jgi:hypothetical protein
LEISEIESMQVRENRKVCKLEKCENWKVGEFGREGESRQSVELGNPGHLVRSGKMGELGQHKNEGNWKIKEN